ncbi:uncharacterized protein SCHCODRAFT_02186252 [Schizophyllum commune H4-8]|uniref:uncharacterized protein n=1 Tax=Schizophyllum commune (strain H4-8 / FGSC 9210) TaxID=578458 RepID=UPI0021600343|nr:uncharacterized protein SCHCODRAFT_02186252 [Schizophyllum commune H4-8]KAI5896237.1 hypothetical protein SCHCODRAFT_02186252 [Schizophyllum commune H4-8]
MPRSPCRTTLIPSPGHVTEAHCLERAVPMAANSADMFWTGSGPAQDVNEAISRMQGWKCRLFRSRIGKVLRHGWKGGGKGQEVLPSSSIRPCSTPTQLTVTLHRCVTSQFGLCTTHLFRALYPPCIARWWAQSTSYLTSSPRLGLWGIPRIPRELRGS